MLRKVVLGLAFGLAASCAHAQTAPSPADVGISKGTPDVFKLKGHDDAWTPFGSVDPSTHIFAPVTNGSITPNDCLKWGPGITSAGAACGSGGSGGGDPLTIYTSHSGLVNNVTTPTGAWTVQQQGFYAPGDGGAATYQWSLTSYCAGGTSGAPVTADGVACVLPTGQSASTAGRYLLQLGNGVDVRQIGMVGDGVTDNAPLVATLMNLISPVGLSTESSGMDVLFPATPMQVNTSYYFSKAFHVTRHMNIRCQGIPNGGGDGTTRLVFAAGVHGLVFDNYQTSPDTRFGGGGVTACGVTDTSAHQGSITSGSASITGVSYTGYPAASAWDWTNGDGIIVYGGYQPPNGAPAAASGAFISAQNAGTATLTLASPYTSNYSGGAAIWRLPAASAFTIQTTNGSPTATVTGGPFLLQPGDYIWSDAFPFGTVVQSAPGTVGSQTVTMTTFAMNNSGTQAATATRNPGKMWVIPAAIKTFVVTSLHNNFIGSFPFGLEMECSDWGTPPANCTGSTAQENVFRNSLFGRIAIGDNTGASNSYANSYVYNSLADIGEFGSVGSDYVGDNSNSAEIGQSVYGVVGLCGSNNASVYIGMYAANPTNAGYCFTGFGIAPTDAGNNVWIGPQSAVPAGAPTIGGGNFYNLWNFLNQDGTQVCMNGNPNYTFAFSSNTQGCGGPFTWMYIHDGTNNMWEIKFFGSVGGNVMWLTEGATSGYTGYQAGNLALINFEQGLLLNDVEYASGGAPGPERLVDAGVAIPSATFHKHGDVHINQLAGAGGYAGWVDTADGANFKPFGPVANDSAGTSWTLGNTLTLTPVALASLPAICTAGTFAVINNGVAAPVYNAAVGATTGAATDPVFCTNGNVWKYH